MGFQLIQAHFRRVLLGVTDYTRTHHLPWLVMDTWQTPETGLPKIEADAALLQGDWEPIRSQLREKHLPWVQIGSVNAPEASEICVLPDHRAIGTTAAHHFLARHFTEFAYFGALSHWHMRERLAGFRDALQGRPCQVIDTFEERTGNLPNCLDRLPEGCALFCGNDIAARKALRILLALGRSVPESVAVAGVDDDEIENAQSPLPLSSVHPRSEALGWKAAEVLHGLLEGRRPPNPVTLIPPGLMIVRHSSDILRVADAAVAAALGRIRREACGGLTVDQLAQESGMSRRSLERRFHAQIGRGIEAEIRRVRLERARELLATSDLSIGQVAERAGFSDIYYFSAAFKKAHGRSPVGWRKNHRLLRSG